jgi:hypothetical protein
MPEEGYTYSQQLGLEFVKSQYGAAVIGALVFPVFGITLTALLAPVLAILFPTVTSEAKAELEKLTPLQWLLIIVNPGSASVYLGKEYGAEVAEKVLELDLIKSLRKALGL